MNLFIIYLYALIYVYLFYMYQYPYNYSSNKSNELHALQQSCEMTLLFYRYTVDNVTNEDCRKT